MFSQIKINLNGEYRIVAVKEVADIAVTIWKGQVLIGKAHMTTDYVDVACITKIQIDDEFVNAKFNEQYSLGEIVIKFLMKFPNVVRKPEFRFILNLPDNLEKIIANYHFEHGEDSDFKNEILIRTEKIVPAKPKTPENFLFTRSIKEESIPNLLLLLNKNAYWQLHLTLDRLKLLIKNAQCFFAFSKTDEVVGFSRVVTDSTAFASLWDVVVDEQHRGKGIGITLMHNVFSDETLCNIGSWVLFTNTAKGLYEKFGFVSEGEIPNRKLIHKLRLQDSPPDYMSDLIRATSKERSIDLNPEQAFEFLFGKQGKREKLFTFWNEISQVDDSIYSSSVKSTLESVDSSTDQGFQYKLQP